MMLPGRKLGEIMFAGKTIKARQRQSEEAEPWPDGV